ncbi:acyl-CoA thioesterase [Streptomyces violaceorubidus]
MALETTIRFRRELLAVTRPTVTCAFEWGTGKTFRIRQPFAKTDGTLAEVEGVGGLMDLTERRLCRTPRQRFKELAARPELFGL